MLNAFHAMPQPTLPTLPKLCSWLNTFLLSDDLEPKYCGSLWEFIVEMPFVLQLFFTMRRQPCKQMQNPKLITPIWHVQRTAEEAPTSAQKHQKGLHRDPELWAERMSQSPEWTRGASARRRTQCKITLWKSKAAKSNGSLDSDTKWRKLRKQGADKGPSWVKYCMIIIPTPTYKTILKFIWKNKCKNCQDFFIFKNHEERTNTALLNIKILIYYKITVVGIVWSSWELENYIKE